jgi:acyl carrier protein
MLANFTSQRTGQRSLSTVPDSSNGGKRTLSLFDRVRSEIAAALVISEYEIELDSRLEDLGADSLEKQALILDLETEFSLEISNDAAQKMNTVRDILEFIESRA